MARRGGPGGAPGRRGPAPTWSRRALDTPAAAGASLHGPDRGAVRACGSDDRGAERSDPTVDTSTPDPSDSATTDTGTSDSATTVVVSELGVSEAEVIELEQQLDEIDRVLADIEEQLAQD